MSGMEGEIFEQVTALLPLSHSALYVNIWNFGAISLNAFPHEFKTHTDTHKHARTQTRTHKDTQLCVFWPVFVYIYFHSYATHTIKVYYLGT